MGAGHRCITVCKRSLVGAPAYVRRSGGLDEVSISTAALLRLGFVQGEGQTAVNLTLTQVGCCISMQAVPLREAWELLLSSLLGGFAVVWKGLFFE